jgi:hypothetical protein
LRDLFTRRQVLRVQVGWINLASDLAKVDPPAAHSLLHPQQLRIYVP